MPFQVKGHYQDGKTAMGRVAHLDLINGAAHLIVSDDAQNKTCISMSPDGFTVEPRLGRMPRTLRLSEGQVFVTADHKGFENWLQAQHQGRLDWAYRLERHLGVVMLAVLVTSMFVYGMMTVGIPKAAQVLANHLPESSQNALGSGLSALDRWVFSPSELPLEKQQAIRLLLAPHREKFASVSPNIHFRKMNSPNAFALMQGDIVFTDALIQMAQSDDEIIAVFFHEVGHLKHKHLLRRVLQDSMLTLLVILITGNVETTDLLTSLPTILVDLSYSRQFEEEADVFAIEAMKAAAIPLDAFSSVLRRLEQSHKKACATTDGCEETMDYPLSEYFLSHPSTDARLALTAPTKRAVVD